MHRVKDFLPSHSDLHSHLLAQCVKTGADFGRFACAGRDIHQHNHAEHILQDTLGNIQRIHNALSAIEKKLADTEQNLETVQQQLKTAQEEVQKPFPKEAELSEKMERLAELNAMLNMDEKGGENLLADEGIGENPEVNVPEERQDRIADSVHKTSILERMKEQKQQEQTGEKQQKPKKKHEQEL